MDKNYNLSDIGNALWAVIDNPVAKIIRSGAIGTIDILNPAAGVVAGVGDNTDTNINKKLFHGMFLSVWGGWCTAHKILSKYIVNSFLCLA